jgi:hypothetical protein
VEQVPPSDHFVVVAHGSADELGTAKAIFDRSGPTSVDVHRVATPA